MSLLLMMQVAGQAVPLTKEVTGGIVRPGGKEVARIADKYSDDATRDKVQVSLGRSNMVLMHRAHFSMWQALQFVYDHTITLLGKVLWGSVRCTGC